jgi:hypothetical protein
MKEVKFEGIERGLGSSLPPAEQAQPDSTLLWKWNVYFLLHRRQRNRGERKSLGDRTRDWMLDRTRLARPASSTGRRAGRSVRVYDRSVRLLAGPARPVTHPGEQRGGKFDRTWWRIRSHATGRVRSTKSLSETSLDSDRTLALSRPVVVWSASGHTLPESVTFRDRWKSNEWDSKRDTWRSLGKSRRRDRTLTASGQHGQNSFFLFLIALFFGVAINICLAGFGTSLSWLFEHLRYTLS